MNSNSEKFSIIVIGAGHAGCEAALASARMGVDTLLLTMNISTIALMPCNPSIGGPGKGHLVREIGALGGEMPSCIDETNVQIKWLNTSKGPAVRSRRAQADKTLYRQKMTHTLFSTANLQVRQGHVVDIVVCQNEVVGVRLETGKEFACNKLVITSGTYLNSRIILGRESWAGGPQNQCAAIGLSDSLSAAGVSLRRLQTATPPRILKSSINTSRLRELPGDIDAGGFLWENRLRQYPGQLSCFLTFTDERAIAAVKRNLGESPLMLENITNVGPKHCPSIDRKILRFPDQIVHQIFIEPEGWNSCELYLQGLTTAMPPAAQRDILASIAGLEHAEIVRYGYAIEYDALAPGQLRKTMENRKVKGLYTAGQINGTSGYEEAAAQGLIAGINAVLAIRQALPYWPSRTKSYIGVLVDDLSLWDKPEPYRITPGHAEFRLSLRDDSAERRLINDGKMIGLVSSDRHEKISQWVQQIENEINRLDSISLFPDEQMRSRLLASGTGDLKKRAAASEILQRPGINYREVVALTHDDADICLEEDQILCVETEVKYRGYAERESERIRQTGLLEKILLPVCFAGDEVKLLPEQTQKDLQSSRYDDLAQLVRKNCLSRSELAILLHIVKKSRTVNERLEVEND